jgi:hypothetical protein
MSKESQALLRQLEAVGVEGSQANGADICRVWKRCSAVAEGVHESSLVAFSTLFVLR